MGRFLTCAYLRPRDESGGPLPERLAAKLLREGFKPSAEPADRWLALLSKEGSPWVFLLDSGNALEDTGVPELRKEARKLSKTMGCDALCATAMDSDAFALTFCGDSAADVVVRDPGCGYDNLGCGPRTGKGKPALWQAFFGLSDEQTQALHGLWQGEFVFAEAQLADMFTLLGLDAAGLNIIPEDVEAFEPSEGCAIEVLHFKGKTMSAAALYRKRGEELLLPLGFRRHKNRFWRIVDEMYQALSFHSSGELMGITFGISPLCMGLGLDILDYDSENTWLEILAPSKHGWSYYQYYKKDDPASIAAVIDSNFQVIQAQLISFFERTTNCTAAHKELRDLYLRIQNRPGENEHWQTAYERNYFFFDDMRFYILLKLGLLNEARELKLAWREHLEEGHRESWAREVRVFGEEKATERKHAWLDPIDADIELTRHPEQVRQLIEENERKSRVAFGLDA